MGVSAEIISQVAKQGLHRSTATETEKQSTLKLGVRGAKGVRSLAVAMSCISGHLWPLHFTCEINSVNCLIDSDFRLVLQLSLICTQSCAKHFRPSLYRTWHTEMSWPFPNHDSDNECTSRAPACELHAHVCDTRNTVRMCTLMLWFVSAPSLPNARQQLWQQMGIARLPQSMPSTSPELLQSFP